MGNTNSMELTATQAERTNTSLIALVESMGSLIVETGKIKESLSECTRSFEDFIEGIGSVSESLSEMKEHIVTVQENMKSLFDWFKKSNLVKEFSGAVTDLVDNLGKAMQGEQVEFKLLGDLKTFCANGTKVIADFADAMKVKFTNIGTSFTGLKDKLSNITLEDLGESLSTSASAIGTKAGTLLSAGLVAGVVVAAAAVATLVAAFQQLMESNDGFRAKVNEAWSGVTAALEPVKDAFDELKLTLFGDGEGSTDFSNAVLDSVLAIIEVIKSAVTVVSELVTGVLNTVTELWKKHGKTISKSISTTVEIITGIVGGLVDIAGGILTTIAGMFGGDKKKIKNEFKNVKIWFKNRLFRNKINIENNLTIYL